VQFRFRFNILEFFCFLGVCLAVLEQDMCFIFKKNWITQLSNRKY